jgi:ribosomal protein S4
MARYTDPVCRLCRREGAKLFLKGTRCYSKKCAFERRAAPPGQHGVRRRKVGDFGLQLREKQKIRRLYSVLERQFHGYFDEAVSTPGVRETHRSRGPFKEVADLIVSREIPDWLNVDATKLAGSVVSAPRRDQMPLDLNEQLVVEYYSR